MNNEHANKRILARGCDPIASQQAAQVLPSLMGNPEYVATSNDEEFINKLKHEKCQWYFSPLGLVALMPSINLFPAIINKLKAGV